MGVDCVRQDVRIETLTITAGIAIRVRTHRDSQLVWDHLFLDPDLHRG